MKKRLIAFLLVLIMVLGILPVSAFAADASASWRVSVQINEGHYYKFDGTDNGTNQHRSTLSVDGSRGHTFGCTFIWNPRAGGEIYAGGWQLCLTVDGTIAEQTDAYVYSRDMTGAEVNVPGEVTVEDLRRGGESGTMLNMGNYPEKDYRRAQTYTLNYYKNTTDTVTNMPEPNPQTETSSTGMVTFNIPATKPTREGYNFLGWAENPDATKPTVKPGNTVTTTATVTKLYAVWEKNDSPVPDNPGGTKPDVANAQVKICVQCIEDPATHQPKNYGILPGAYVDGLLQVDGTYYYSITLNRAKYIEKFDQDSGKTHTDTEPNESIQFKWQWKNGKWELISDIAPVIKVKCTPVPTSDEPTLANTDLNLIVKCVTNNAAHSERSMPLKAGTFKMIGTVQDRGPLKFCTIEVETAQYVAEFDTDRADTHTAAKTIRVELYLKKNDSTAKWTNNKSATDNVIEVTCEPEAPTADELKKLQMAVLVKCAVDASQQHTAAYGLLGECDVDYFVFEPRQEGDDWLCDISYYPERYVAEFNTTFQNLKHVQNDEKIVPVTLIWAGGSWQIKTQGRVYVTEVYTVTFDSNGGTPVPQQELRHGGKVTMPAAPTREGYTFDGWYLGDEKYDFSAAVKQNITLTAKWSPATVYLFVQPVDSKGVKLVDKDTSIKDKTKQNVGRALNADTLARAGFTASKFGGYNHPNKEWITVGKMTTTLLLPTFPKMTDITGTWLDAVKGELKTGTYTPHADAADFKANISQAIWTKLQYMTDNYSHYGYEGKSEGYHLDGELTFYWVKFDGNGATPESMPTNNYGDVYDYYITGGKVTMPAAPTRDGYSFEGWSVEVIPAENDADHLDADGADDAADETLLKAGETYTIGTKDVKFVARWEKKTFTVKYYLPDETGAWVEKKMDTVDSVDYATYSLWTPDAEDGYEFSGWYQKTADIGVKAKVEKLYMAKEWKLYGKFTPIEYNIQYVYNDGKATSTNPTTYTVESDAITLADATGADWGKTFLEWHDENDQKITEIPTGSTGNRVIKAYWNWPVYLHYLDKDNKEIESATLYVSELEPGACVLPTGEKTGYDFDGWYEAKKDIGTASYKLNDLSIAKKWELYGRYTAKTDVSYTVRYLREGDNKVLAPEKVVTDQTFDTEVTEQAADVVGYTPDAPSKTMILDEYNKVLTFSYSANTYDYTVRHIKQLPDGSYDEANAEVETLSGKFEALAAVTAKDYGAHYPTNDADTKQNIKIEEGLTIDVKYDLDEHTLTFETNGGSAINPVTVRHGNAVARPADPTKDKYTFIGWYADPEFTEEYDFATVLEADKTIYAKFELTSTPIGDIYVRYDVLHIKQLPDGTYDLANAEVEHLSAKKDTTVTAVAKNYRATHHVNVNRTLSKLTDTAIQAHPGADGKPVYTILTVYYDLDFHTLTFDTMGGSKIAPETVRHGLTVAKPKDPVNGGYIFDGWYTDKTFRHRYDFSTPLTEDITIYAKWFLIVLPGVTVKKNTPKLNTADHFAYVQGYPDGTVKPAGNITRAETAAILFRLMDEGSRKTYYSTKSGFRDVASGSWYNTYVATLNNAGVITDSSNGYFRPNEAITRAELAAMLANFTETTGAANYFNDVSAKYWAANAIAICAKLGWINGYPDGTFRPDKNVTRAELMAMINRATGRAPKSADAFLPGMKTWKDNTADKWYYLDVQEATNSHSYTVKGSETWTALTSDPNWSLYE